MDLSHSALEIVTARYFKDLEKTWDDLAHRVGYGVGGSVWGERYVEIIQSGQFIAGGRINRNVGRKRGSLFNCYNIPIGDSREEIGELFKNALILWGEGGGVGINFSTLRPVGAEIKGVGGKSSGLVSFMRAVDGIAATIESGGQRRAASLGLCEVSHPEVEAFINAKKRDGDISYFNISVGISEQFIDAVRNNESWSLRFNQQLWDKRDARELWNSIMEGMVSNGEPGLINMSNLTTNNSYYFAPVRGTNPCGETCLEDYGVCNLGSIVLPKFVMGSRTNWQRMEEVIRLAVRFLDTCIDINRYTLQPIKQAAQRGRRIGLGVMGLADMLFSLGLRYGSRDAIDYIERLFKFIRNIAYEESIKISMEKGSFPAFDSTLYCKAKYIRTLPPSLRRSIRKNGTRNVTLLAIAPTGTISLVAETTSGIEPLTYKAYERSDRVSTRHYIHPTYYEHVKSNMALPDYFVDTTDLKPEDHIDTQAAVQKYVDGAVSKTINVPKNFKAKDLSEILLESIDDLKGVTVYRDGSREGQIIKPISKTMVRNLIKRGESFEYMESEAVSCPTGKCEIS